MLAERDIIAIAKRHLGEPCLLGAAAPPANPDWRGPWEGAGFVSWCVWQALGIPIGLRPADPRRGESLPGWWEEEARVRGWAIPVAEGLGTPGAVLVRRPALRGSERPRLGHVAISLGDGRTVEAGDAATGVAVLPAPPRGHGRWA